MLPTIDFKQIRPHDGSQDRGFEELCCQLAHLEAHPEGEFIRKGRGGDAGVECFWRLSSGDEYGWQAKYLFKLGDPEISQLNKSFQEAFAKHTSLCRYVVCLPFDLSDARAMRKGRRLKSQLDRWDELVQKWKAQASEKGRPIEFVLWDASRISGLLADDRPQYAGKVLYWFGAPSLAPNVLRERVEVAIKNLGPRYTPALHVDLPIAHVLDGLCWGESFRERAREMRRALHKAATRCQREAEDKEPVKDHLVRAVAGSRHLADALEVLADVAPTIETAESLRREAEVVAGAVDDLRRELADLQRRIDRGEEESAESNGGRDGRTLNNAIYTALRLDSSVEDAQRFLKSDQVNAVATRALLVRGDAGTGKSHLLADVVRKRAGAGLPAVLVLGQHVEKGDAWNAVRKALDLPQQPAAYILGALDAAAEAGKGRALIAIDAINEGAGASLWRDQLAGFLREASTWPRVALVLTCRTTFERRCAPDHIEEGDLTRTTHRGFAGHIREAIEAYFDRQGLIRPSAPTLSPEFHNPLFLKTVTKALKIAGLATLPRGLHGVKQLMDFYGQCLDAAVAREMDVPDTRNLGTRALRCIAKLLAESSQDWAPRKLLIEELDGIADDRGRELLELLVSEGALLNDVQYLGESDDEGVDVVRFAYQRFSDHYITETLLKKHLDPHAPNQSFAPAAPLGSRFHGEAMWDNAGTAEAMAIQVPGMCGREFIALLAPGPEDYHLDRLAEDFLASIVWRDLLDFTAETLDWLNRMPALGYGHGIEDTLLRVATEPEHPYNADFLDKNLITYSMPDRDAFWSIYLATSFSEDGDDQDQGPAQEIVDWSWHADKRGVETERLRLCAIALTWMFSTSNRRLRDRATKGLVNILCERPALTAPLLQRFATIDDPYIRERLYAAAYGAALNHREPEPIAAAAGTTFRLVFAAGNPLPHLLFRDYARGLVELAAHLGVLADDINMAKVHPPYWSEWPLEIPTKEEVESRAEEWDAIAYSVFHSDFNWYTMNSLERWTTIPAGEHELAATFSHDELARWIYKRAYSFGWTSERFEEFEKVYAIQQGRGRPIAERIGKKYQHIALSELEARLSDHVKPLQRWSDLNVVGYQGPWQLGVRDIDPSLLIERTHDPGWGSANLPVWWCPYEADFSTELSVCELQDWLWSAADIPEVRDLLTVRSDSARFTVLNTYWTVRQRDKRRTEFGLPMREVRAWIQSAIVHRSDVDRLRTYMRSASRNRSRSDHGEADLRDNSLFRPDQNTSGFFIGEWPWHPSTDDFPRDWTPAAHEEWGCPVPIVVPVVECLRESGAGDTSIAETISVLIPSKWLMSNLNLRFTNGREIGFSDDGERVIFCDPSVAEAGPSAALIDTQALAELLEREGLALVWTVAGEKSVYEPLFYGRHCFSGLYHWDGVSSEPTGELWKWEDRPEGGPTKIR